MEELQDENIILDVVDLQNQHIHNESVPIESKSERMEPIIKKFVTSHKYEQDDQCLNSMKLPEIRETLKYYKNSMVVPSHANNAEKRQWKQAMKNVHDFALIGTKQVIMERLRLFYKQDLAAICILRRMRGFFVKNADYLRGPASKDRSKCVNPTDFYTMDPLEEIAFVDFYSYADSDNFIYGFDLHSLVEYIKNSRRRIKNPYNRSNMDIELQNIRKLGRLNRINAAHYVPPPREIVKPVKRERVINNVATNPSSSSSPRNIPVNPHIPAEYDSLAMIRIIRDLRSKTVEDRMRNIFMEIDQLGNYTQMSWLTELQLRDFSRFFRILKDIWNYRAQLSHATKVRVCPLWDPFTILSQTGVQLASLDRDQWCSLTVSIMEDMICTGVDVEHRTLGAFHVLSALTMVSNPARLSMPWLYESLVW